MEALDMNCTSVVNIMPKGMRFSASATGMEAALAKGLRFYLREKEDETLRKVLDEYILHDWPIALRRNETVQTKLEVPEHYVQVSSCMHLAVDVREGREDMIIVDVIRTSIPYVLNS